MKAKRLALLVAVLIPAAGIALSAVLRADANKEVSVHFVCLTNSPQFGTCEVLRITNHMACEIACEGYGYVDAGGSATVTLPLNGNAAHGRMAVRWQSQDLDRFDIWMNGLRHKAGFLPLFPLVRHSYSEKFAG